jgi:CRISPR system Cascade subunit CasD
MTVLLLRLAGPMQSWGVQSRFTVRDAGREPSKSGVIGLLCAALGRPRRDPVADLAALAMGVRVDQEGRMLVTVISNRYYMADARFLVALAGPSLDLLRQLHQALQDPHWPLFLGRKAFVPAEPVWLADGLLPGADLAEALAEYPWLGMRGRPRPETVRLVLEDPVGPEVRPDQPLSFSPRRFAPRRVRSRRRRKRRPHHVPLPTDPQPAQSQGAARDRPALPDAPHGDEGVSR